MSTHTLYGPGTDVTVQAATDLEASRFVEVAGDRTNGNITVRHAAAGKRVFGVIGHAAKAGTLAHALRGSRIVGVAAAGAIVAGADVSAAADGKAVAATEGTIVAGQAISNASSGIVYVALA